MTRAESRFDHAGFQGILTRSPHLWRL